MCILNSYADEIQVTILSLIFKVNCNVFILCQFHEIGKLLMKYLIHNFMSYQAYKNKNKKYALIMLVQRASLAFLVQPLWLIFFLPSLPQGFLSSEGRNLMKTSHLGLSVLRSLTLSIMSGCRSMYLFPSAAGRSFSDSR